MKRSFESLSEGLLFITLGIIFFLLNYGYLSWDLWEVIFDLWPLILILAGIGLIFNRRMSFSTILLIFLICVVVYSFVFGDKTIPGYMNTAPLDDFHL